MFSCRIFPKCIFITFFIILAIKHFTAAIPLNYIFTDDKEGDKTLQLNTQQNNYQINNRRGKYFLHYLINNSQDPSENDQISTSFTQKEDGYLDKINIENTSTAKHYYGEHMGIYKILGTESDYAHGEHHRNYRRFRGSVGKELRSNHGHHFGGGFGGGFIGCWGHGCGHGIKTTSTPTTTITSVPESTTSTTNTPFPTVTPVFK